MDTREVSSDPVTEVTRLTNRAAALAFASAFAIVLALVALPSAFLGGDAVRGALASGAVVMALAVTAWAWRARAQLRDARKRAESFPGSAETRAERIEAPPGQGGPPTGVARTGRSNPDNRSRSHPT